MQLIWKLPCWILPRSFGKVSVFVTAALILIGQITLIFYVNFTEDDRFEPEYEKTLKYFNVASRISILNKRLDVMENLNQILMDSAHNVHASVLEWIIIVLIAAEVLIEMFSAWRETYH